MGEEYRGAVKMKSAEEILVDEAFNTDRKRGSFRRDQIPPLLDVRGRAATNRAA